FTEDIASRLKVKSGAASSGPSYKAGSTDTRAVLVLREALPRELCIGRSAAPHKSVSLIRAIMGKRRLRLQKTNLFCGPMRHLRHGVAACERFPPWGGQPLLPR